MPVAGVTEQIHYIGDKALFVKKLGADHHEYLHRDHIGSIVAISGDSLNSSADAQFLSNGAWGERRMAQWNGPLDPGVIPSSTAHGFTDHEHLDAVGLIHMKGRVYDPELGRFLSADPHVQAPYNSQSYNRYAYVFNNPLSFTDPTGYDAEIEIVVIGNTDGGSAGGFTTGGNTGGDTGTAGGGGEQTVDLSSVREFIPDARIDPGVMLEQQWMKMDELNSKQGINSLTDLVVGFLDPSEGARECKDKGCGGGGWAMAVAGMLPGGKAANAGAKGAIASLTERLGSRELNKLVQSVNRGEVDRSVLTAEQRKTAADYFRDISGAGMSGRHADGAAQFNSHRADFLEGLSDKIPGTAKDYLKDMGVWKE